MPRGPVRDAWVRTRWKRGPAADSRGELLVSFTAFVPDTLRDVPGIYRAAERLRAQACAELDGAVGLTTYWQPLRRRVGSLSAWTDEAALRRFIALPYHREIMRRYRTRGYVLDARWQADAIDLAAAFRQGVRMLDAAGAVRGHADPAVGA